jgi:hypothetical protein
MSVASFLDRPHLLSVTKKFVQLEKRPDSIVNSLFNTSIAAIFQMQLVDPTMSDQIA